MKSTVRRGAVVDGGRNRLNAAHDSRLSSRSPRRADERTGFDQFPRVTSRRKGIPYHWTNMGMMTWM